VAGSEREKIMKNKVLVLYRVGLLQFKKVPQKVLAAASKSD
jgi:hypothetical protein